MDFNSYNSFVSIQRFQSTLSVRRATARSSSTQSASHISIHALRECVCSIEVRPMGAVLFCWTHR
ncbi:hypothetical protein DDE04_01125 [Bifidobacterium pseudocatenulatum]|nr:hypothetical protein [Bifidobacterium pseudocatenulatum]